MSETYADTYRIEVEIRKVRPGTDKPFQAEGVIKRMPNPYAGMRTIARYACEMGTRQTALECCVNALLLDAQREAESND